MLKYRIRNLKTTNYIGNMAISDSRINRSVIIDNDGLYKFETSDINLAFFYADEMSKLFKNIIYQVEQQ